MTKRSRDGEETCAISNRPRERCDPATTPARLRNADQERERAPREKENLRPKNWY
ncbi:hypothetical protein [Okeania sp. KiyG1]|uniref:hypothetical protein n=1 Tax=Okeania sp. KiyG1 TaxID=2720165 RepID=UPI0019207CBF|nr:hypothetical protein [Okeania sp. KiyG1]